MHKIIASDFEIDLSSYSISIQEENSWFSDSFFTKYSYPFDLVITDEINKSLGDVLSHDSRSGKYFLECKYVFYNKIENALLIFERIVKDVASVSLKYGMDEFPNFEKNLNELELLVKEVPSIYFEAELTINKTYPVTNYNFPQVHADKYDPNTTEFNGFQKIINNRGNTGFLINTVEEEAGEDVMYNRNIMQPMPYLMYVLKKGFSLSGLNLKGDIIDDSLLSKILIYAEKDPFIQKEMEPYYLTFSYEDVTDDTFTYEIPQYWTAIPVKQYIPIKSVTINVPGKYNIIGQVDIRTHNYNYAAQLKIYKDNQLIFTKDVKFAPWAFMVDIDFILPSGSCEIKFEAYTSIAEFQSVVDLQILPVYFINSSGKKETNLLNENKVDLNKTVPNTTFGSLVNAVLNLFNYDVDLITKDEIYINRVGNSIKTNEIIDLSMFENVEVERKPKTDTSFLFKYDDEGEIDLGGFFIEKNGSRFVTKGFNKIVQNTISIPIYPLQNELIDDVFTAKSVNSSDDKICFVMFDGFRNNTNCTLEPIPLSIANVVDQYYYKWLKNRVNSMQYDITFTASAESIIYLTTKKRGFAYNNIHLFKNITKNQLKNELFEVELETETLTEL